jgi:hypothetical protein
MTPADYKIKFDEIADKALSLSETMETERDYAQMLDYYQQYVDLLGEIVNDDEALKFTPQDDKWDMMNKIWYPEET